jgi:dihydroorotate dehydrogenase
MLYRALIRPILYLLPAETAHGLVVGLLRFTAALPLGLALLRLLFSPPKAARVKAFGRELPSPVGLAAGFDKEAHVFEPLLALGFGFVEVGTITAHPQAGNPKPRLFRLPKDRALINRMGFNNAGAQVAAARLAMRDRSRGVVGVNIGKTKVTPPEQAIDDYVQSATLLAPHADYMVVNVSSPNTPGLRDMQAVSTLRPLLTAVRAAIDAAVPPASPEQRLPLLVKIAPDLADEDIDSVADLALELKLDGIVATNTTIGRSGLESTPAEIEACGAGGLSGAPLAARSLEVLGRIRARLGPGPMVISVGGIERPEQVRERLAAGATLVQVYTGLVYEGPTLPQRLAGSDG